VLDCWRRWLTGSSRTDSWPAEAGRRFRRRQRLGEVLQEVAGHTTLDGDRQQHLAKEVAGRPPQEGSTLALGSLAPSPGYLAVARQAIGKSSTMTAGRRGSSVARVPRLWVLHGLREEGMQRRRIGASSLPAAGGMAVAG
jgi:hypothetical protein